MPSLRDFSDYDGLSIEEKVGFLLEHTGDDEASLFDEYLLSKPRGGWSARKQDREIAFSGQIPIGGLKCQSFFTL